MAANRHEAQAVIRLPAALSAKLAGYAWVRDTVGESGGTVVRLHAGTGGPDLFLKHGQGPIADDIVAEMVRLRWLAGRIPVPAVEYFSRTRDETWLLTTALPGKTAYRVLADEPGLGPAVVDALAAFLRRLHAISASDCPFNSDADRRLADARARMDAGLVDEDDFDEERRGWQAGQVWEAMETLLPLAPDPVVTHGDFALDNLLIHDGEVAGCIDTGRVGVADRYQDLAIAWHGLGEFGATLQNRFLQQYGIPDPDRRKLQFHLMLDEFF